MAPNVDTIIPAADDGDEGKDMDSLEPLQPRHSGPPPAKRAKTEIGTI